jgi:acyl-coA dehydrogenase
MSEQVIELLPETTPATDAPAESVVPSAAPESADEGSAVPAETQPSVNAEEPEMAEAPAEESISEESAAEETEQNEDSTPDTFTPLDEEVGAPSLGVPHKLRRTSKVDEILAAAKDVALQGVREIAPAHAIGLVHHVRAEEERLSTHLFECSLPGYRGWFWFATLSRAPRSRVATICEVGLLPGDDALIAPDWVPWADRVRPEDLEENAAQENAESAETAEAEESAELAGNKAEENESAVEETAEAESAE